MESTILQNTLLVEDEREGEETGGMLWTLPAPVALTLDWLEVCPFPKHVYS